MAFVVGQLTYNVQLLMLKGKHLTYTEIGRENLRIFGCGIKINIFVIRSSLGNKHTDIWKKKGFGCRPATVSVRRCEKLNVQQTAFKVGHCVYMVQQLTLKVQQLTHIVF